MPTAIAGITEETVSVDVLQLACLSNHLRIHETICGVQFLLADCWLLTTRLIWRDNADHRRPITQTERMDLWDGWQWERSGKNENRKEEEWKTNGETGNLRHRLQISFCSAHFGMILFLLIALHRLVNVSGWRLVVVGAVIECNQSYIYCIPHRNTSLFACNTGNDSVSIHPALPAGLNYVRGMIVGTASVQSTVTEYTIMKENRTGSFWLAGIVYLLFRNA